MKFIKKDENNINIGNIDNDIWKFLIMTSVLLFIKFSIIFIFIVNPIIPWNIGAVINASVLIIPMLVFFISFGAVSEAIVYAKIIPPHNHPKIKLSR